MEIKWQMIIKKISQHPSRQFFKNLYNLGNLIRRIKTVYSHVESKVMTSSVT